MIGKSIAYLQNVRQEMSKVSWPTWAQLRESTAITLVLAMILALFIFGVDKVISFIIGFILS